MVYGSVDTGTWHGRAKDEIVVGGGEEGKWSRPLTQLRKSVHTREHFASFVLFVNGFGQMWNVFKPVHANPHLYDYEHVKYMSNMC